MKVFVTGSSGFIGRPLVRWLEKQGHNVLLMQRRNPAANVFMQDLAQVAANPSDLRKTLFAFRPDAVLHLAWGNATNTMRDHPCHYLENLRATQSLVDIVADDLPGTYFLGVGSQAEYGVQNKMLDPQSPCAPVNAYGKAKRIAGEYALARLGSRASWLRLFTAYGPDDDANKFIPYLLKCYREGSVPATSPGAQSWDWLYVDDAAEALGHAMENRVSGLHVLTSGEMASFKDIALKLKALALAKGWPAKDPNFGGRAYNSNELFFLGGDSSSLKQSAGWNPRVNLATGLVRLF